MSQLNKIDLNGQSVKGYKFHWNYHGKDMVFEFKHPIKIKTIFVCMGIKVCCMLYVEQYEV